jgi:subtilisin family serine protease
MPDEQNPNPADEVTAGKLDESNPEEKPFVPESLDRTVIAIPLLRQLEAEQAKQEEAKRENKPVPEFQSHKVIIDLNLEFPGGRDQARAWVVSTIEALVKESPTGKAAGQEIYEEKGELSPQYVFASLQARAIQELVVRDALPKKDKLGNAFTSRAIYHIWPDFEISALTNRSISTVKADAARAAFAALGDSVVWAVMDSGIEITHSHFQKHENWKLEEPLNHLDFTGKGDPKSDPYGHGTHVAGIIGGEMATGPGTKKRGAVVRSRDEKGVVRYQPIELEAISGMAPKCKLVSLRVLDENGKGDTSSLIAAIAKIQEINGYGRRLLIHGVNISVGNSFDPEWFACGQSPLCTEVNHLVNSGVVVVVAAGNSGYGTNQTRFTGVISAGLGMTINDPGNADEAITVGATHRDMPHIYGVSYFSSKGPTGDGRAKPDIVAPGEKIISCAAGKAKQRALTQANQLASDDADYVEDSGTSMAAPHVSGVIAAFLSIRREFIGHPDKVKEIFLATATDLKRERYFQGHGLVDLMRAIQSV